MFLFFWLPGEYRSSQVWDTDQSHTHTQFPCKEKGLRCDKLPETDHNLPHRDERPPVNRPRTDLTRSPPPSVPVVHTGRMVCTMVRPRRPSPGPPHCRALSDSVAPATSTIKLPCRLRKIPNPQRTGKGGLEVPAITQQTKLLRAPSSNPYGASQGWYCWPVPGEATAPKQ